MAITTRFWTRVGDNPLGLGMNRFEDDRANALWRLEVTRHAGDKIVEIDANVSDLIAIKTFCDKALDAIATDGGRAVKAKPQAA